MAYRRPPLAVFIEAVKRYDKRIGLRMLYKEYEVPAESRPVFRNMWDRIAQEVEYASKIENAEATDGNGAPQSGQDKVEKPRSSENEPKPTPRLCGDKGKGPEKPKKEKTKKKKPKQSASKT
ncbi:hypothetical protein LCGC14_1375050 [marine sediment metagenome]|uniref:Uncharacterized protein n=1 Tax=marine sediment metagenome TaxID=412755 RepID=A0A0F9K4B2_9ZZZZ